LHVHPGLHEGPEHGQVAYGCRPVQRFGQVLRIWRLKAVFELRPHRANAADAPHRAVVPLAHLRQVESGLRVELRQYIDSEHVRQFLGDSAEDVQFTASQALNSRRFRLAIVHLPLLRRHGAVASEGEGAFGRGFCFPLGQSDKISEKASPEVKK